MRTCTGINKGRSEATEGPEEQLDEYFCYKRRKQEMTRIDVSLRSWAGV